MDVNFVNVVNMLAKVGGVPDARVLDRLLRYEASLDRSFERTLSQLERLQRMRLGQPILPKLDLHRISYHFFLLAAFLMSGAAVFASASVSNPSTAENFRPTA